MTRARSVVGWVVLVAVLGFGAARAHAAPAGVTSPPRNLSARVVGSQVTLTWQAPASGVPTSYQVEAGSKAGASDLGQANVGNATSVGPVTVQPGTVFVRARALNAAGASAPSNEVIVTVGGGCSIAPNAPRDAVAVVVGSTASLRWSAPASGPAPTSYVVEAGTKPGASDLAALDVGLTLAVGPFPIASGGTVYLRVRARNACGLGAPSNEVVAAATSAVGWWTVATDPYTLDLGCAAGQPAALEVSFGGLTQSAARAPGGPLTWSGGYQPYAIQPAIPLRMRWTSGCGTTDLTWIVDPPGGPGQCFVFVLCGPYDPRDHSWIRQVWSATCAPPDPAQTAFYCTAPVD